MPDPISTSSSTTNETIKDQALKIAEVLRAELTFPIFPPKQAVTTMVGHVSKGVPDETSFQTKTVLGKAMDTPKLVRGLPLSINDSLAEPIEAIYDMVARRFLPTSSMSIEHALPHKEIKLRQKAFLDYLNDSNNQAFTDDFLKQEAMGLYFQRQSSGEIWATNYFFKACYNDIGNLWLLSVGANASKSSGDVVDYLEKIFGASFKQDVEVEGGVQRGIILSKIGGTVQTTLSGLDGNDMAIYSGGKGIGQFITDWHDKNRNYCFEVMQEHEQGYQIVQRKLDGIIELFADKKAVEANKAITNLQQLISSTNTILELYQKSEAVSSSSESETASDKEGRERGVVESLEKYTAKDSLLKKIKRQIVNVYYVEDPKSSEAKDTRHKVTDSIKLDRLTLGEMSKLRELITLTLEHKDGKPALNKLLNQINEWAKPEVQRVQEALVAEKQNNQQLTEALKTEKAEKQELTNALSQAQAEIQQKDAKLETEKDLNQKLTDEITLLGSRLAKYEPKAASQVQSSITSDSHLSMSQKRPRSESDEPPSKKFKGPPKSTLTQTALKNMDLETRKVGNNADSPQNDADNQNSPTSGMS